MDSASDHRRLPQHQSSLQRRRTADCGCVWTTELSIKPRQRTDTLSHWSRRWSTDCEEPEPSRNWTSGMSISLSESRKGRSTRPHFALGMGSSSTESCHSGGQTHQLLSKPISTIAYGLTLTTSLCATLIIYWSTRPMRRSTKSSYEKCWNDYKTLVTMAKPKSGISESRRSASSDLSLALIGLPWNQTAYQQLRTGQPGSLFRTARCFLDWLSFTGGSLGNM